MKRSSKWYDQNTEDAEYNKQIKLEIPYATGISSQWSINLIILLLCQSLFRYH